MADFRRWLYALAVVALLVTGGLAVPANAQTPPAFQCSAPGAVPTIARQEGYTELVGDILINCTGGSPTAVGQTVPQANITVSLNTNITSKITATVTSAGGTNAVFDEALMIMDEPNTPTHPTTPILSCGSVGAPDTGPSGPGICAITADGSPTYSGGKGSTSTYGAAGSHPNVFQGRMASTLFGGTPNTVIFQGVPLDPPGTINSRNIRITNIRADATRFSAAAAYSFVPIVATITISGSTSLSVQAINVTVATINPGLVGNAVTASNGWLQCIPETLANGGMAITFKEGFPTAWKTKNFSYIDVLDGGNGTYAGTDYSYNGTYFHPADIVQNVPGALYNTESGFMFPPSTAIPNPNPPLGLGTATVTTGSPNGYALTSANYANFNGGTFDTGISAAGTVTQGTRFAVALANVPTGVSVYFPTAVLLKNQATNGVTGVMVMTSTDSAGAGAYTPPSSVGTSTYVQVSGLVVYEVLFSDPLAFEYANILPEISYVPNLSQNLPQVGQAATAAVSFAPFYTGGGANLPQTISAFPIPRFLPGLTPAQLFVINKCACNILFPWVASVAGFDTGIALANTSLDPGAANGFTATPQSGTVTFWYFGLQGGTVANIPPQTSVSVPAGQVLTYVLSQSNTPVYWTTGGNGLDNRAAGFSGYVIAQAQFQYCHAFAYLSALGAGPTSPGISEGYLGLIMDKGYQLSRTVQTLADSMDQ